MQDTTSIPHNQFINLASPGIYLALIQPKQYYLAQKQLLLYWQPKQKLISQTAHRSRNTAAAQNKVIAS